MLRDFILQQPPVLFALAAVIDGENQIVVVVVVRAPQHALIALILKSLRRNVDLAAANCRSCLDEAEFARRALRHSKLSGNRIPGTG